MDRSGRLALVSPRYGAEVIGGAELVMREVARRMAARGWEVEVLTTAATSQHTWANELPVGEEHDGPVLVRRFPAVADARAGRGELDGLLAAHGRLDLYRQQRWVNADMRAPELFHFLLDEAERYRAVILSPYHAWTTFAAAQLVASRAILIPCLHDEAPARFEVFEPMFNGVAGIWFMSEPERDLMARAWPHAARGRVVGEGFDVRASYDAEGFRRRHGIDRPFVLYAGRREGGKNWEWLMGAFAAAVARYGLDLALVTMGQGDVVAPATIADRVVDVGFLADDERDHAYAAAAAYVQPSTLESFSRTICEAWLAGTPVLANAGSDVVAWHVGRSGAGLLFADDVELAECLKFVTDEPVAARALGAPGREYVVRNYGWDTVLDAYEATLAQWLPAPGAGVAP